MTVSVQPPSLAILFTQRLPGSHNLHKHYGVQLIVIT